MENPGQQHERLPDALDTGEQGSATGSGEHVAPRRAETILIGMALATALALFGLTLYFIVSNLFFSPDEAGVSNALRASDSYQCFSTAYPGGGILSRWVFYELHA